MQTFTNLCLTFVSSSTGITAELLQQGDVNAEQGGEEQSHWPAQGDMETLGSGLQGVTRGSLALDTADTPE